MQALMACEYLDREKYAAMLHGSCKSMMFQDFSIPFGSHEKRKRQKELLRKSVCVP